MVRQGNKLVKIKQEDYIRLHRIVTGLNVKTVWESLVTDSFDDLLSDLPDEFHEWALTQRTLLLDEVDGILDSVERAYEDILETLDTPFTRGQFAQHAKTEGALAPYLFAMYDKRDVEEMILKSLKPKLGVQDED